MHFSNAGFVELVNSVVFNGNAILLRIDFDKEYRCNAYTKYSYLRNYMKQINDMNVEGGSVHVHFVDDAIISGRTFHRAKTLMNTIMGVDDEENKSVKLKIFDKVFVLIDRNSSESRRQYVDNEETDFYAFTTVNISSLRNYGDSCVYCNLEKESELLFNMASTKQTADYWEHEIQKFQLCSLEQYTEEHNGQDFEKQFRRLFCTHMAQTVLRPKHHGNDSVRALKLILKLVNTDYESRKTNQYEYFLSYLKCISRPFLVFNKAIKEAIFDIMLILIDALVCRRSVRSVIKEVEKDKPYLNEISLIREFNKLDKCIIQKLDLSQKEDLVRLLMKQLTELKSNYIIRPEKMEAVFTFIQCNKCFDSYYITLIVRLVGSSSDTNKSIWLDEQIRNNHFLSVPLDFRVWVLLENTRAFRDGIEKLYKLIYGEQQTYLELKDVVNSRIDGLKERYDYVRVLQMFRDFQQKYENKPESCPNEEDCDSETLHNAAKRIERFLKSLPELKTLSVAGIIKDMRPKNEWNAIFDYLLGEIEDEHEEILRQQRLDQRMDKLSNWVTSESDGYQFGVFQELLSRESFLAEGRLVDNGSDMIACCLKILDLCRNNDLAVLEKVKLLAMLFKVILGAQSVQFIIEDTADSNLEEWKNVIEKRYNQIVDKMEGTNEKIKVNTACKKQYLVIVERAGSGDTDTEISSVTEKLIEELELQEPQQHNYIISEKFGVVLWKLENHHRSIWINIINDQWKSDQPEKRLDIAIAVRKVMMFYQELMKKIFNPENDDYINEISHARKTLNIYTSNKVYTHTKEFSREMLYEQAKLFFCPKEDSKIIYCNYPSYVLKLLADINISKYYRYGLSPDFYHDDGGIRNAAKWGRFAELIRDGQEFRYCIGKEKNIILKLQVARINGEDQVLCTNSDTSIREMNMLLFAIILNAAEQNRGKRQNSSVHSEPERVLLNIYKEQGFLIIENECEEEVDTEEIQRKLHCIPVSEDEGISLWSFNCYIKQRINSLILAKLKEIEECLLQNQKYEGIEAVGKWIERLTGSDYEIQTENRVSPEGQFYFKVKIPIFMEKFQERR